MSNLDHNSIIAVIGAGTMGAGIAQVAANAGHSVLLFDNKPGASLAGIEEIYRGLSTLVVKGKKTQSALDDLISRIIPCEQIDQLANANLIIEAIVENLSVKQNVFNQLQNLCDESTVLATNTSSISVTSIAAGLKWPDKLVGMHFFNPAPIMKLVEVISGVATDEKIAKQVYELASSWGKKPVYARSTPGFIVNRVARPFYAEALKVLQEGGASIDTIDSIMKESGGFKMGPLELTDLIGQDINYSVTESVFNAFYQDPRFTPSLMQLELVNAGYLGRKSGRGFYHYDSTNNPSTANLQQEARPENITVFGYDSAILSLASQAESVGIKVAYISNSDKNGIEINNAWLTLTDGRLATQYSVEESQDNCIFFDLALDYKQASRIALTKSEQCSEQALKDAIGFIQVLNKHVSLLDDLPGMLVMRTVCMLANEGADAVNQQVCSIEAVDIAMQGGVNYPRGPMQWADDIGLDRVVKVLNNMENIYGEGRYRVSPLLLKHMYASKILHSL